MLKLVKYLLILSLFTLISGCGPGIMLIGPAVTGVIYWVNGDAHKYYEENLEVVYRSTKHALNELNLSITKDEPKDNSYYILAGGENRFSIHITKAEKNLTKLSIRINILGDKDMAELIYKKVDNQLDTIIFNPQGNPTELIK